MQPTFSIIMTSYNHDRYVGAAIESVLAQTLGDWELLIVDDCSPDSSWDVISSFADPRITAVRLDRNVGNAAAYNYAYSRAHGTLIASLDCDDMYHPKKLQRQKEFLDLHNDVGICGTLVTQIGPSGETIQGDAATVANFFNVQWDPHVPASWIWQNRLCHSSAVIRKPLHDRIGLFNESMVYYLDWDFWLRCFVTGVRFHIIEEQLTCYREHDNNVTGKNPRQAAREYTDFAGRIFHPYLRRIGRSDLIARNIEPLLERTRLEEHSWEAVSALLDVLLPQGSSKDGGSISYSLTSDAVFDRRVFAHILFDQADLIEHQNQALAELRRWSTDQADLIEHQNQALAELRSMEAELRSMEAELRQWSTDQAVLIQQLEQELEAKRSRKAIIFAPLSAARRVSISVLKRAIRRTLSLTEMPNK
jgi:glycosyltransferase involved in cell wall biosynthesis